MRRCPPAIRSSLFATLCVGLVAVPGRTALAQGFGSGEGYGALPSFAWAPPASDPASRWAGSFALMSTGFEVASSKRLGSYAGPTIGFQAGRMWQEGRLVYGVLGGFDYLNVLGGGTTPGYGRLAYSRDFAGALQVKVGALLTPDVLLYAKAGAVAVREKWQVGPSSFALPFEREDVAVRPDARVGVEWAVTDRLSVAIEAGVGSRGPYW